MADELKNLGIETADDILLVKKIMVDVKAKGVKQAIIDHAAEIVKEAKDDFIVIKAAIPVVKAGYKTTEFWLIVGDVVANVVASVSGHPIPFDVNAIIGGIIAVYTLIRGLAKKPTV